MTASLHYVVYAAGLTLLSLFVGSFFRNRLWSSEGMKIGMGNRELTLPPSAISGRADRAAMNTLENFVIFAALVLTAHVAGVDGDQVARGAAIFFWARLAYLAVYLLGIAYLRTVIWVISLVGEVLIVAAMF